MRWYMYSSQEELERQVEVEATDAPPLAEEDSSYLVADGCIENPVSHHKSTASLIEVHVVGGKFEWQLAYVLLPNS